MPSARMAFTVCMQSSLGRNPCNVHSPFDNAATMTARCEMLLSPGTVISVSIRGARLTRNSIDQFEKDSAEVRSRAAFHPPNRHQHRRLGAVVQFSSDRRNTKLTNFSPIGLQGDRAFPPSYGTRKIFPVYGSFTSVPGGNPFTSTYLPGKKGFSTTCTLSHTEFPNDISTLS